MSLDIVEERRRSTFASPTHKDSGQPEKAQAARHKWVIEKEPPAADSRSLKGAEGGGETRGLRGSAATEGLGPGHEHREEVPGNKNKLKSAGKNGNQTIRQVI